MGSPAARSEPTPFLPPAMMAALKRSALFVIGGAFVLICGAFLVALATYSPQDPSLNTATDTLPVNAFGTFGAVLADLSLQAIGVVSAITATVLLVWSIRVMRAELITWLWLRTIALMLGTLILAVALTGIPAPEAWPINAGLGGSSGRILLDLATDKFAAIAFGKSLEWLLIVGTWVISLLLYFWVLTIKKSSYAAAWTWLRRILGAVFAGFMRQMISVIKVLEWQEPDTNNPKTHGRQSARVEPTLDGSDTVTQRMLSKPTSPEARKVGLVAPRKASAKTSKREMEARQGSLLPQVQNGHELPSLDVLTAPPVRLGPAVSTDALEQNARLLESVLEDFGIRGEIVKVRPGPVVTLYELAPAPGTKTSRVVGLADDIARSMSAIAVRIAVVPGRSVIGIELPNEKRETVYLREMLASDKFANFDGKLNLALGKNIGGAPVFADLSRMPHLLVAGTTGSGKSVAINTMIMSLLYRHTPDDVRLLMIDPKMLELSVYDGIPHLLSPVVTDPGKAVVALKWVVREMENRYRAMSQLSVRNIAGYNQRLTEAAREGRALTRTIQTGFDPESGGPVYEKQDLDLTPLPHIIVIIDEMADLMLVAGKEVEAAVQRLAQMARASGIHVIMATQRPSVDVITGTIKANFPTRISFQVTSKIDSRTILGEQGAEQLLGHGDMLYMAAGGRITRVHGPFVSDREVEKITTHLREQAAPVYLDEVTDDDAADISDVPGFTNLAGGNTNSNDALFDQAAALVARERKASTSFIQRHLQIGYNRAARIIEEMEAQGMITRANHVGKRDVLLPETE